MEIEFFLPLLLLLSLLLVSAKPIGLYMSRVLEGSLFLKGLTRFEARMFRLLGIYPNQEMGWTAYATALVVFNALGFAGLYALQRVQGWLPFNPEGVGSVPPHSAFNTSISFVTNTNWQSYIPEATVSSLTQMLGLTVQNFLSAASGIAVAFALIRGLARQGSNTIGNFWVDVTRITLYILLPLSLLLALGLASQGVVQNLKPSQTVDFLDSSVPGGQRLAMGPVASQEAIKELGTNGGGFFNSNASHPFENPNAVTSFLEILAILLIPSALCLSFGEAVGDKRQGWALWIAMAAMFLLACLGTFHFECAGNPALAKLGVDVSHGSLEGKEVRFGVALSSLFATATTAASCGAVNAMHDSFSPLGGLVPMWLIQIGEVVFGGVGSGLYGMLVFAILAVFIAGLMVGRTPEYLGKKIEAFEMKMSSIVVLVTPFLVLTGTALAVATAQGRAGILNPGPHGFSEVLYAFSSASNNNGSAFAGLSANTSFYNAALGVAMWVGRFGIMVPVLAMAGSMAKKKRFASSAGSMPTHGLLFVGLLIGTVAIVGALTYLPALALGPIAEHFRLGLFP